MRALGFPKGQVLFAFLLESLIISGGEGLLGCLGALAMGSVEESA
ncbi:MAG: hypothetical protein QM784_23210 [Polyangiaceae bacterium]